MLEPKISWYITKQDLVVYDMTYHTQRLTAKGIEVMKLNHQFEDYLPPVKEMI